MKTRDLTFALALTSAQIACKYLKIGELIFLQVRKSAQVAESAGHKFAGTATNEMPRRSLENAGERDSIPKTCAMLT